MDEVSAPGTVYHCEAYRHSADSAVRTVITVKLTGTVRQCGSHVTADPQSVCRRTVVRLLFSGIIVVYCNKGYAVAHLVETLRYKPEGRGFDYGWCHWNFLLT